MCGNEKDSRKIYMHSTVQAHQVYWDCAEKRKELVEQT